MITALFALAAAMLIAGVIAVVEGFPYVRLESGMAMVYGGAVVASSGILLFGLAVVATWLRRIEAVLRDAPVRAGVAPADPAEFAVLTPEMDDGPSPVLPMTGGTAERPRIEPSLVLPPRPPASEPELPMPGLASPVAPPPPHETPIKAPAIEPAMPAEADAADALFVPGHPEMVAREPTPEPALRSSLDAAPEVKPERVVVGRYSSGGNTYMMYDDGAIEADTPNGRFTFASLDELKAFVDGGGETGTRGAA